MAWRKRAKTFISNWLGVVIAAIIVIISATFGGMYLYARTRVDNAVNFVTQGITLRYQDGLAASGPSENPPGYFYHLILQVFNPYGDTVEVTVADITVQMDVYTFNVTQNGSWQKSVSTGYDIFEGDFIIPQATSDVLLEKGTVELKITGTVSGSGHYQWVSRTATRTFDIDIPGVLFEVPATGSGGNG